MAYCVLGRSVHIYRNVVVRRFFETGSLLAVFLCSSCLCTFPSSSAGTMGCCNSKVGDVLEPERHKPNDQPTTADSSKPQCSVVRRTDENGKRGGARASLTACRGGASSGIGGVRYPGVLRTFTQQLDCQRGSDGALRVLAGSVRASASPSPGPAQVRHTDFSHPCPGHQWQHKQWSNASKQRPHQHRSKASHC